MTLAETILRSYFFGKAQWIEAFFEGRVSLKLHSANRILETLLGPFNLPGGNREQT